MDVIMNGELLDEVECCRYLGSHVSDDRGIDVELRCRINIVMKVWGGMRKMFQCTMFEMNAKRQLFEGVVVLTALYEAKTWNIGIAERKAFYVMEMRCLRSTFVVMQID